MSGSQPNRDQTTADGSRAALTALNAAFSYDGSKANVAGLTFSIPAGRLVAVLGPNGGGKTTLMRGVLGDLKHIDGSFDTNGKVGHLPQLDRTRADFPVTALDVAIMGGVAQVPWWRPLGKSIKQRARKALKRVDMHAHANKQFGELSGGQRRRVLLARTLVQGADILLLDEPFAGVDPVSASIIEQLLRELRDDGATLLVATHEIDQAHAADLVLCVNHEQIAFGDPAETLSADVLERTYGADMTMIGETGDRAVAFERHHHHED